MPEWSVVPGEGWGLVLTTGKECAILLLGHPLNFFQNVLYHSHYYCVLCMCVQITMCHGMSGWGRGQHCGAGSLLTPSVGSGSGTQVARLVQQTLLHQPNLWSLVASEHKRYLRDPLASRELQAYGALTAVLKVLSAFHLTIYLPSLLEMPSPF